MNKLKGKIEIWSNYSESSIKRGLPPLGKATKMIESTIVDTATLSDNFTNFLSDFQKILEKQPKSKSGYEIDEIELSLGVDAKGGIALLGKLEAGVQAGIKVKLKRKEN